MNFFSKWRNVAKFDFNEDRYQSPVGGTPLSRRIFRVLHGHDPKDLLTKYLDRSVTGLIVVSVLLDTFLDVQSSEKLLLPLVGFLDWLATIILTIEMVLKFSIATLDPRLEGLRFKRLRFLIRPMSILDFFVIFPSWLSLFFPLHLSFVQFLRVLRLTELVHPLMGTITVFIRETRNYTFRRRTYSAFFGGERDHGIPGVIDFIIFAMIMMSVLLMTLESVDWLKAMYKPKFHALDMVVTCVFLFEYFARLYCCVENPLYRRSVLGRLRYMLTGSAIIDLAAVAPFFLGFIWETPVPWLWALRLLRMLKLGRYSKSVSTILAVVREERAVLSAAIMMLLLLTLFAASGIYVTEHSAQPEKFSSIPVSMYWAVITLTSIGYGDYYPITPIGKLLTMVLAVAGLGMIALPAGILANGFSQKIKTSQKHHHRDAHGHFVREDEILHNAATTQLEKDQSISVEYSLKFTTIDEVFKSEAARRKLNDIIYPLNRAEREALIALTAISLSAGPDNEPREGYNVSEGS